MEIKLLLKEKDRRILVDNFRAGTLLAQGGAPRGQSAYEQAVEGGYSGTKEEFEQALATGIAEISESIDNVDIVAENIEEVSTVAGSISDVHTVSENIETVVSAATAAQEAKASATEAATSAASAAANATNAALSASQASESEQASAASAAASIESAATATSQANAASQSALSASSSATSAQTSATNAQKWAEGADSDVAPLGGTHSSKEWANVAKQYAESIGAALKYKGSVSTYSALPSTGQEVGDMWNVLDTGKNYVWTGAEWDDLSGVIDLSAYRTAAQQDVIDATKQDVLVSGTNIKTVNGNSLLGSGNVDIDALPSQTGQSGKFLTTNGTDASWADVDALPSQTGQSGKFLTTNGSAASWADIPTEVDNKSVTLNNNDEIQAVGVIDQKTSSANKFWTGTKAEYDAIVNKDPNTTYRTLDEEDECGGGVGADTSLSNLTNTGKIQVATLAAPSDTYDDLVLGASGNTYTMPADGYLLLWIEFSGQYSGMQIYNTSTHRGESRFSSGSVENAITLAVRKGEVVAVSYWYAGGYTNKYFRFFYAKGSESEKV